jgi:hypothetical protein
MAELPVVRVSIIRATPETFPRLREEMGRAQAVLEPGIRQMPGLLDFIAGADEATSSLNNVSFSNRAAGSSSVFGCGRSGRSRGSRFSSQSDGSS